MKNQIRKLNNVDLLSEVAFYDELNIIKQQKYLKDYSTGYRKITEIKITKVTKITN